MGENKHQAAREWDNFATAHKKGGSNLDRFSDTAAPTLTGCWISLQHEELNFLKVYNYTTFFMEHIITGRCGAHCDDILWHVLIAFANLGRCKTYTTELQQRPLSSDDTRAHCTDVDDGRKTTLVRLICLYLSVCW